MKDKNGLLYSKLVGKSLLKKKVFQHTLEVFKELKDEAARLCEETGMYLKRDGLEIQLDFKDKGEMEAEICFGSDTLVFGIHTNVFEFSRIHEVMKTPYIIADPARSFCGQITFFNFLADSFRFNRMSDLGYLVARVFINKEKCFLVEGKHQTGFYYNQFMPEAINQAAMRKILEAAMSYSIDFDLLVPPYDLVKEITVADMVENHYNLKLKTAKRLGFKFLADHDQTTSNKD
ncbi:MAG TPA: hypothetical protein VLH61_12400 [Bacteroidales bacterium]|nr:hypothetical protein [Bacteroidales bacterium]